MSVAEEPSMSYSTDGQWPAHSSYTPETGVPRLDPYTGDYAPSTIGDPPPPPPKARDDTNSRRRLTIILVVAVLLLLISCISLVLIATARGGAVAVVLPPSRTATAPLTATLPATATPLATATYPPTTVTGLGQATPTFWATHTPIATYTPYPTFTLPPRATSYPTYTPYPTPLPATPTATPHPVLTVFDDLADWSLSYAHNADLQIYPGGGVEQGDVGIAYRQTVAFDSIVWKYPNLLSGVFICYFQPSEVVPIHQGFAISSDGLIWQGVTATIAGPGIIAGQWNKYTYTVSPISANFIRMTWQSPIANGSPECGSARLTYQP